jgi:hypothetical protein
VKGWQAGGGGGRTLIHCWQKHKIVYGWAPKKLKIKLLYDSANLGLYPKVSKSTYNRDNWTHRFTVASYRISLDACQWMDKENVCVCVYIYKYKYMYIYITCIIIGLLFSHEEK